MYDFKGPDMSIGLRDTAQWLFAEFVDQPIRCLEVGVYEGQSGCWLLDNILTHPESRYTGVDLTTGHEEAHEQAVKNLILHGRKANCIVGDSAVVLREMISDRLSFEIIYVDGCHSEHGCEQDVRNGWQLLAPNGIILCDDYQRTDYGVADAVNRFLAELPNSEYELLYRDYKIAWRKLCQS